MGEAGRKWGIKGSAYNMAQCRDPGLAMILSFIYILHSLIINMFVANKKGCFKSSCIDNHLPTSTSLEHHLHIIALVNKTQAAINKHISH